MTPFQRAHEAAQQLRTTLFKSDAALPLSSSEIISAISAENAEDFDIADALPQDEALGGADAVLIRQLRLIIVRKDVSTAERAFLITHEFGHWKLHHEGQEGCHKVVDSTLKPAKGESFGVQKVEAYGARERAELQANIFARELLLPRSVAAGLLLAGRTERGIATDLDLPLELVRQQLLDGLLLPEAKNETGAPVKAIKPTAEQLTAAHSPHRTSLVVAGPGTGKTATLLMRVQHLLAGGAKPQDFLILTFSNRAARELVDRLQEMRIGGAHEMWVGTFHSFGLEFLRKNHGTFGLQSRFGVADRMAQIGILEPHIYGLGLTTFNPLGDPLDWLNEVVKAIQRCKDELADAARYERAVEDSAPNAKPETLAKQRDTSKLYRCYEQELRSNGGVVDLGDLVMLPALALTTDYERYEATVGRFRHILVDEYQDVNRASASLVKSLEAHSDSLWVVGDARQAIYRFRGASMRNVVHFNDDFPNHKSFSLNDNHRSYEEVIRVVQHAGRTDHPIQMVLPLEEVEGIRGNSGVKPRHIECASDEIAYGELGANVERIHSLGVPYRDQAVLASTHDTCGAAAGALNAVGIPALYLGDIFQRTEVKDVLALLQLLIDRSGSGLVRVSQLPGLELSPADVDVLLAWLRIHRPPPLSWLSAPPPGLSDQAMVALGRWVHAFGGLSSADSPWDVVCSLLLERTGLLMPHLKGDGIIEKTCRIALWQLIYYLRTPDGGRAVHTVGSFITALRRRLQIGDDRELRIPPPEADTLDAVAVMTIHGSKGLEFEAVHLVDIDAKHFRMSRESDLMPKSMLESVTPVEMFEEKSEAANKLYVALSRAREHLVLYEMREDKKAECVAAIDNASHLLERVQGMAVLARSPAPVATLAVTTPASYELAGFVNYHVCPRRYYYDHIKELTPSAGLHPASLVEGAVMRELFSSPTDSQGPPTGEVESALAMLPSVYDDALPHLQAYGDQLRATGRTWLGTSHGVMPKPFTVPCGPVRLRVAPHRLSESGSVITLDFVRIKPSSRGANQQRAVRWMLRHLSAMRPERSIQARIFALATAKEESISDWGWTPDPSATDALLAGDFEAKPKPWNCPRCRHFMYCPA